MRQSTSHSWRSILLAAIALGLSSGVLEVAILAVRTRWLKEPLLLSEQFVWMVPLVTLGFFVGMGVLLRIASWAIPERNASRLDVFSLAFLASWVPLLALPQLTTVPHLQLPVTIVLAAGVATFAMRVVARRTRRDPVLWSRLIAAPAAAVILLAFSVNASRCLKERDALAHLAPARPDAPNVLLIVLDTVRAQSLSLYGYPKGTTPQLQRLAAASVVFDVAVAPTPWTLPSHASMFTGHWPHELSVFVGGTPLDGTYPTLADVLRTHGYATAGFVANLIYGSSFHGLDRGFIRYEDYPISVGQAILSSSLGIRIASNNRLRYWLNYHHILNRKTAAEVNRDFSDMGSQSQWPTFFCLSQLHGGARAISAAETVR